MTENDPWIVRTLADVARFFGVRLQTVKGDWRGNGMPGQAGAWDLREIVAWRNERQGQSADNDAERNSQRAAATDWEAVKLKEDALLKRLRRKRLQGELVQLDVVMQSISETLIRIRDRLLAFPEEIEMGFPQETRGENVRSLESKIENLLREMSQWEITPSS